MNLADRQLLMRQRQEKKSDKSKVVRSAFVGTPCVNGHGPEYRDAYSHCLACRKESRAADPNAREKEVAAQQKRRAKNPAKFLFVQLRNAAKKRGQKFEIVLDDLLPLPTHCPVLGIKLNYSGKGKKDRSNWPSVDRRDSNIGYVRGNVTVMSYRANRIKGDATVEEMGKILAWMKSVPETCQ